MIDIQTDILVATDTHISARLGEGYAAIRRSAGWDHSHVARMMQVDLFP